MISEISFGCVSWQKCPAPFKVVCFCPFVPGHFSKNGLSIPRVIGSLSAKAHRPPYGKDGDYFSKPSADDVFEKVYEMMSEVNPSEFPTLY